MERIQVYIDGGNFYHLVIKKLGIEENNFDFDAFAGVLIAGRTVSESYKRFYKGAVREKEGDPRSKELMSEQTKLFTALQKGGWEVKTSKLRRRIEELVIDSRVLECQQLRKAGIEKIHTERMREKGIDVKIATDLLVGAFDNKYDTAIVVSSDADLVPAIDWVRKRKKKRVEYIGFSIPNEKDPDNPIRPLELMFHKTDVQRVFSDIEMRKFIKPEETTLFSGIEQAQMKTILVDAVNAFVSEDGEIFKEMYELLEQYPNRKIILTGADDEQFKTFGLDKMPYDVFTLKHDPEKTDPEYFRKMLAQFQLSEGGVVYFEHNPEAVKSAQSVGITSYLYDNEKKDLDGLKRFLDESLV